MFSDLPTARAYPIRRWTALASFTLQAAIISVALIDPLLHPEALPRVLHPLSLPLPNLGDTVPVRQTSDHSSGTAIHAPIIVNNHRVFMFSPGPSSDHEIAQAPGFADVIGTGSGPGVADSIVGGYARPMPHPVVAERPLKRSVMMEGNLIHKVEPQYPVMAKQLHIAGAVLVKAVISREGIIENAEVERGHPLLARAALEAVRQWRYRPYYLNNLPIEVETEITVNFVIR